MSKNYWQIKKQNETLRYGKSVTSRVSAYVRQWEGRCYKEGIPDKLPRRLEFSGRAPSWRQIALCVLRNDHALKALGLSSIKKFDSQKYSKRKTSNQMDLF